MANVKHSAVIALRLQPETLRHIEMASLSRGQSVNDWLTACALKSLSEQGIHWEDNQARIK